jgi:hypothetical protein
VELLCEIGLREEKGIPIRDTQKLLGVQPELSTTVVPSADEIRSLKALALGDRLAADLFYKKNPLGTLRSLRNREIGCKEQI